MLGIAVDIDGTLVDMNGRLYPATAKTLAEHWSGACVILASARPPQGIRHILQQLGRDGPYIALNGGLISLGPGHSTLPGNPIPAEVLGIVYDIALTQPGIRALFTYDIENWYAWGEATCISQEMALTSATPIAVRDETSLSVTSILKAIVACESLFAWEHVGRLLLENTGEECTVRKSRPYYIEITAPGINKGAALDTCREAFRLKRCIAIGDGLNDLDMFVSADVSYAAPTSPPELKEQATHILDPPHDLSLARLFYQLLAGKAD